MDTETFTQNTINFTNSIPLEQDSGHSRNSLIVNVPPYHYYRTSDKSKHLRAKLGQLGVAMLIQCEGFVSIVNLPALENFNTDISLFFLVQMRKLLLGIITMGDKDKVRVDLVGTKKAEPTYVLSYFALFHIGIHNINTHPGNTKSIDTVTFYQGKKELEIVHANLDKMDQINQRAFWGLLRLLLSRKVISLDSGTYSADLDIKNGYLSGDIVKRIAQRSDSSQVLFSNDLEQVIPHMRAEHVDAFWANIKELTD